MIQLLLTLAVVGFLTYLIVTYIPMPAPIRSTVIVIVVICLVFWVLQLIGFVDIPVPRLR